MIADGKYFIYSDWARTLVLDVPSSQTGNGVIIQQFGFHGGLNQQWELKNVGDGFLTIVSVVSQKALDVPGGLPIHGLPIQQFNLHGGPNQQWKFDTTPEHRGRKLYRPEYHRISNRFTQLALDIPNGSTAYRVKLQQWAPHNGWNQTWLLGRV